MPDSRELLWYYILHGDAVELLRSPDFPEVHCVVTSPPYFQKRQYGEDAREIGGENTVQLYIHSLVRLFNAIRLHAEGSVWVNLGDKRDKNGQLFMIPERFALHMKDHGWSLLDKVVWAKVVDNPDGTTVGHCMIEPAKTRLNGNGYEYLFRFVKRGAERTAWVDPCAISLPRQGLPDERYLPSALMETHTSITGRLPHNVWRVPMGQAKTKHYAVYPTVLCERPIAFTCPFQVSPQGVPTRRMVDWVEYNEGRGTSRIFGKYSSLGEDDQAGRGDTARHYIPKRPKTVGWTGIGSKTLPGIVLDPFCGSGTTGEAALRLGRAFIGIDLYELYCNMARERCAAAQQLLWNTADPWKLITGFTGETV